MIVEPPTVGRPRIRGHVAGVLFLVGLAPRLVALAVTRPPFDGIPWELSENLLQYGQLGIEGTPRTDFEPLYPLFLAGTRLLGAGALAVQVIQAAVAALGTIAIYRLTTVLTGSQRTAAVAAVLYAAYPLLIRHSIDLGDTVLITTLLLAFASAFSSIARMRMRGAVVAGLCLGLLVLTRAMTLPLVALGFMVLLWKDRPSVAVAFAATALVLTAPSMIRNYRLNGALTPTRGGWNLFIGNCDYAVLPQDGPDVLNEYASSILVREGLPVTPESPAEERQTERVLTQHALTYMRQHPMRTAVAKLRNVMYTFMPRLVPYYQPTDDTQARFTEGGTIVVENSRPRPRWHDVAYSVSYSLVMSAAIVGMYRRRALLLSRDLILWAIVVTFVAVYSLYFPTTRYLAPISSVWLFYAAVAVAGSVRDA